MFSVAITGEIGSGKSTLAKIWGLMGANVVDLDSLAKGQWLRPEIKEAAAARWGEDIYPGGRPDFARLADRVYRSAEDYRFATGLIHPGTRTEAARIFRSLGGWVVFEIPLLFETGWFDLIDCIVCVTANSEIRKQRVAVRGWSEDELSARERFMIETSEKQAASDVVMENGGSLEEWEVRARELGALLLKMSTARELSVYCKDSDEARAIMSALVGERLAAGANITGTESMYRWRGEITNSPECLLRAFTVESCLREATRRVREIHSYELPAIMAREMGRADYRLLKWVVDNCGGGR